MYNFEEIDLSHYVNGNSDQKKSIIDSVRKICETSGCFYLKINDEDFGQKNLDQLFETSKQFFRLPLKTKMQYKPNKGKVARGYYPLESDNVNAFMGRIAFCNDPVEAFCFGPMNVSQMRAQNSAVMAGYYLDNIWPDHTIVPNFKNVVENFYMKLVNYASILARLFAECLEIGDAEYFNEKCQMGPHNFNLNFYPVVKEIKPGQDRFPLHKDANLFTFYAIDSTKNALMAKYGRNGPLKAVQPKPDTLIVMLGEVMEHFTDGEWVCTEHMVQWPPDGQPMTERASAGLFFKTNLHTVLSCVPNRYRTNQSQLKLEPITFQQFFDRKIADMMKLLYIARSPKQ